MFCNGDIFKGTNMCVSQDKKNVEAPVEELDDDSEWSESNAHILMVMAHSLEPIAHNETPMLAFYDFSLNA